jgi:hypothetical protein
VKNASVEVIESAQLIATAFSVTNRVNDTAIIGTIGSPLFGRAIAARESRQIQASLQVTF